MLDELDISHAPRGVLAASKLVEAVASIGDLAERHYLELKGPSDLVSKSNKAKIAKFILGAANRMPDKAAAAFEGCAVMIIGITANGAEGVPPIEMLELSKVIEPFLGPAGPRWDIVRVPVASSTNEVLVVVVEPPTLGQSAFPCRANGEGLADGRIYIRADGETREVTSAEYDLLVERGRATPTAAVDFDVSIVGAIRPIALDEASTLEIHLARVRQNLMSALPRPAPASDGPVGIGAALAGLSASSTLRTFPGFAQEPEDRSEEEYVAEIEHWEDCFREVWPEAVDRLVGYARPSAVVRIVNKTSTFFHDLQVQIHLEGDIRGVDYRELERGLPSLSELGLPEPPRAWGPQPNRILSQLGQIPLNYDFGSIGGLASSRLTWTNSGSIDLTLDVGDLRPRADEQFDEEEIVLALHARSGVAPVRGTWQITARGFNQVFEGSFEIALADGVADFTPVWERILDLADGDDSDEEEAPA